MQSRPDLELEDVRADLIARYDAEIVYTDAMFGRAIADLKRRGLYDSTLIIFTSDHGEEFHEHGHWGHGHSLYRELLHVPLIVKFPKSRHARTVVETNVQQVDIVPTVLATAGVEMPPGLDGIPLMDAVNAPERRMVSYLKLDGIHDVMSALYGERQYILWRASSQNPSDELLPFDSTASKDERVQLARDKLWRRELRKSLWKSFQESRQVDAPEVLLEGEVARRLRALGYLQ